MPNTTLRNFDPAADFTNLVQLRATVEAADQHGNDTSPERLRSQFDWPGHDPAQDRWVIERTQDSSLIGHGWTFAQSPTRSILDLAVHPQWRRQGLGTQLLAALSKRAKEKGSTQIVSGARANNDVAPLFLRANEFEPVGNNRFFVAPANTPIEEPQWPAGFSMRSYAELGELHFLVEGSNHCYADMWGHRENTEPLTVAFLQQRMVDYPNSYFPEGILVVFDAQQAVAGICFNRLEGEQRKKTLDSPGVVPKYRHLGLQRPLVQASMQWLNAQANGEYHLDTFGDFDEAVEIYRSLGFTLAKKDHLIEYLLHEAPIDHGTV